MLPLIHTLVDASAIPVLGLNVPVGSMSLRCVTSTNGRPGVTFPPVGRLGLTSPPSQSVNLTDPRYNVPLRLPKARLGSFGCPSVPDTLRTSCVSCSFFGSLGHGRHFPTPGRFGQPVCPLLRYMSCKETVGSPKFPGSPCEYMPCSQTPVVSCILAITPTGVLPSPPTDQVGFPSSISRRGVSL